MNAEFEIDAHAACRKLESQGKKITNRAVLDLVGRGSHSDVGPAIKSYLGSRDREVPDWLIQLMEHSARSVWGRFDESQRAAAEQFSNALRALNNRIVRLQAELDLVTQQAVEDEKEKVAELAQLRGKLAESEQLARNLSHMRGACSCENVAMRSEPTSYLKPTGPSRLSEECEKKVSWRGCSEGDCFPPGYVEARGLFVPLVSKLELE